MIAENLFTHLQELGVVVSLKDDMTGLDFDAPKGALSPELVELLREHKADLIELVYETEERRAIEGELPLEKLRPYVLSFEGDKKLIEAYRHHPQVAELVDALCRHGGGVVEFVRDDRRAA